MCVYIGHYLISRKCLRKHNCSICYGHATKQNNLDLSLIFSFFKKHDETSDNTYVKLYIPAEDFYIYIDKLENIFLSNIKILSVKRQVGQCFKELMQNEILTDPCENFPYNYLLNLFSRFRIFAAMKFANHDLVLQRREKRKSQKYINVAHL